MSTNSIFILKPIWDALYEDAKRDKEEMEQLKNRLEEYKKELEKHQDLSRTASAGMFKGGLADNSEMTTKYHTAKHLLLAGLRKYLGKEVYQKAEAHFGVDFFPVH